LLLGIGGALLGVAAGVGFAGAINSLFKSFGIDLPNTGTVLAPRTVIVSLLVGALVTLAAGVVPALRATRVSPIAALRDAELPGSTGARRRLTAALAALLMLAGVAITCIGLFGGIESSGQAASLIGGGAVAAIFGVALFSPRLVRPLASAIGRPIERLRGLTGRLARENTMRRPGRTAVTAAALMIGLGLVSFVTIFAAGVKGSVDDAIDNNLAGDISIQNKDGFSPIAEDVGPEVTRVPGVGTVSTLATANARVAGVSGDARVSAVEPRTAGEVLKLDFVDGSGDDLASLGRREAIVDRSYAESNGIGAGDTLRVTTPSGKRVEYDVVAEVRDNADFLGDFILTQQAFREDFGESKPFTAFVKLEPGADAGAVQGRIERVVDRRFPAAEVLSQDQLKDSQSEQVNQLLGLIYALLSLAVVVSVFGIVNTLVLSIHERTRELGMLRAIGMSRRQVRRVIRHEAVITSLIGAVLGMALGVLFAALISSPLADEGFSLSFPIANLAILLVLAILAGILAAILPARRAARLDVLRAVAYE
jgi:putative ABC transport system permease protein